MTQRRTRALALPLSLAIATATFAGQGPGNGPGPAPGNGSCSHPATCVPVGDGPFGPPTGAAGPGNGTPSGPGSSNPGAGGPGPGLGSGGDGQVPGQPLLADLTSLPAGDLTEAQAARIAFVREEEKLARDLYRQFAATWRIQAFSKVAEAEQRHFDLMGWLISRYSLDDPAFGQVPGRFTNSSLQALYDELLAIGQESATSAWTVGGIVEETDLVDVEGLEALAPADDLATVAENLARGSRNHLRGFVQALAAQGATDEPALFDAETYAAIVDAAIERGAVDADGEPIPGAGSCSPAAN